MKRLLLVFVGLMAGLAHAQSFDWNRAWSGCSAEASAFDAESRRQSTPEHTARKVMRYVEEVTGTPPSAAKLQTKMEEDRGVLRNPNNWAYLIQLSSKLALCGTTAALNQLQNGSTQTAQRAPTPAPAPVTQQESDEDVMQCVRGIFSESALFNGCRKGVNLVWCAIPRNGATPNVSCEAQQFSPASLSPGGRVSVEDNFQIAWTMCDASKQVVSVRYISGRGLEGKCRR